MKIGFFLSSLGGSPLQAGLERGFRQLGHHVSEDATPCDLLLVFNQSAHAPGYSYPGFPTHTGPLAFIDSAEYGFFKRLPSVAKDYQNTFSHGSMAHDTKSAFEQLRLKAFLDGRSFPYFIREHFKFLPFPESYYPIDYPLYESSGCPQAPDREEYLRRTMDLFVSWGLSHPWRTQLTEILRAAPVHSDIRVLEENGTPRMPQDEFFRRTREARCSVSFDGYGSSSFRLTEVLVRCLLLRGPLSIRCHADLTDGVNCIDYGVEHDGETFVSSNVDARMLEALADPERCFRIYDAGYHHCMEYLTEKATAEYVLKTVEAHDWSKPTPLDL